MVTNAFDLGCEASERSAFLSVITRWSIHVYGCVVTLNFDGDDFFDHQRSDQLGDQSANEHVTPKWIAKECHDIFVVQFQHYDK